MVKLRGLYGEERRNLDRWIRRGSGEKMLRIENE